MACSTCGGGGGVTVTSARQIMQTSSKIQQTVDPNCSYTNAILFIWANKLKWFKDKALYVKYGYPASEINRYLGTVLTSINILNKCTYETILNEMVPLITLITSIENDK